MRTTPLLDPDRDQARRLLEEELASGGYQVRESITGRVWRWFTDLFSGLPSPGALPGWVTWVLLAVVLLAVLSVLAFAARGRWRTGRMDQRPAPGAVLEGERRDAAEHRDLARRALAGGDRDTAVLEGYRALTMSAIERTLLDDRPGRTAHEVALVLAPVFPGSDADLRRAADTFDGVRYGERRSSAEQAEQVVALVADLDRARPELAAVGQGTP